MDRTVVKKLDQRRFAVALAVVAFVTGLFIAMPGTAQATRDIPTSLDTRSAQARAPLTVPVRRAGGYSTVPAGHTAPLRDLGASVTVPAGQTRYLSAKLVVSDAAEVTETSALIYCRRPGSSVVAQRAVSGQNVLPGRAATTILTRGLITAPPTTAYVCSLQAQFVNHQSTSASGHIFVLGSSYLQDVQGSVAWHHQTWQSTRVLDDSSVAAAPSAFTVPNGVSAFQVIGDVNVTTCYTGDRRPPCDTAARTSYRDAYVGTQLVVQQLDAHGAACGTPWTNGPLTGATVSNTVHHFKINTWGTVPVNSACGSRSFRMWIRVTANASRNSIVIESNNQTVTGAFL
ncbi:MAG: hypothetical protein ACRCYU_04805 [Nocardioides sp.]